MFHWGMDAGVTAPDEEFVCLALRQAVLQWWWLLVLATWVSREGAEDDPGAVVFVVAVP